MTHTPKAMRRKANPLMYILYLYAWHLFYCWQERRRGELSEAVSLQEFRHIYN